MKAYDFVAIGGGSAGFNAARVAHSLGMKTAIVDGAKELGGLCILRGCMPSKTLLWATEVLHQAQKASLFGLKIPEAKADLKAMQKRKRKVIDEFAGYRMQAMESGKYDLYRSQARFLDPHTLELKDGKRLRSRFFIIATGSRISVPKVPGLADTDFLTSDDILNLNALPKSIIVLGGGVVACELAQYLMRAGSKVTLIQRSPHILKGFSAEAATAVETAFREEGMRLHTNTELLAVGNTTKGACVRFFDKNTGRACKVTADKLLNALGRDPLTEGLGLAEAGVDLSPSGRIQVNSWQQSSQKHIYAGGDVCGPHDIVHLAVAQGELAARHAARVKKLKPVASVPVINVAFTSPALASIGPSEALLKADGIPFLKASYPFNDHGKSILMDAMHGFVKVLAEPKTGKILGAEIAGPEAGELIHCFNTPMVMGATVKDMLRAPWYHPTLAEILTYPLEEIADQLES